MLLTVAGFRGSRVLALDGALGRLRDVYFDDAHWQARYLVIDKALRTVVLSMSRAMIQSSPSADWDRPVSRQPERVHHRATVQPDAHLRSVKEVSKYCIGAVDGWAGRVADFLLDDETWSLRYFIVELGIWPFAHRVLIGREHVQEINWGAQCVNVDMTRAQIQGAADFDAEALPLGDIAVALNRARPAQRSRH